MKMRTIIKDIEGEGLESLLGKRVLIMSAGYFYEGELVGVSHDCVKLSDPHIIYETGEWGDKKYSDIQKLHTGTWYVSRGSIESFGLSKNV